MGSAFGGMEDGRVLTGAWIETMMEERNLGAGFASRPHGRVD